MPVSFTRTGHILHPLGSPDDNYLICIAKVQCSSLFIVTDANLKRLFLYDARRPYSPIQDELLGYHRNDLSIASVDLLDPGDGTDAVCGDVCVDDSGHDIYALIIKKHDAYIKVFKNVDRELTYANQHYDLPKSGVPYTIYRKSVAPLNSLSIVNCLGLPVIENTFCYGTGLAYFNGTLHVLTRREVQVDVVTLVRYDAVVNDSRIPLRDDEINPGPFVPGSEDTRSSTGVLLHLRIYDKRTTNVRFNLLTQINAETGIVISNTRLTQPSTTVDYEKDGLIHSLSVYDGKLWAGYRWDRNLVPSDLSLWHLSEGKAHIPKDLPEYSYGYSTNIDENGVETYSDGWVSGQILGFMQYEYALYDDWESASISPGTVHISDRVACTEAYRQFMRLAQSQNVSTVQVPTPIQQTRGPTMLIAYNLDDLKSDSHDVPTFEVVSSVFPFDIALPYSMTHDQAERKLYCAFGNQAWVFDCLDYTILVNHPDSPNLFEGDIIDMGDVLASNRQELQCFIRNDATFTMYGVTLTVEVSIEDPRTEDLFLTKPPADEGYKTITLGDIAPGESREFGTRVYSLGVKFWEDKTTHTLPLRVYYDVEHDDF